MKDADPKTGARGKGPRGRPRRVRPRRAHRAPQGAARGDQAVVTFGNLVAAPSSPMVNVFDRVEYLAPSPGHVLVLGETGTGKEEIAQQVHRLSSRTGELVYLTGSHFHGQVAASELLGHEARAFVEAHLPVWACWPRAVGGL